MKLLLNPDFVDWRDSQSYYFFNPKPPQASKFRALAPKLPVLKGHIYLFSSSFSKICVVSKEAFLFSASKANKNLKAGPKDRWLITLPLFHVSGLSIRARAFLSQASYHVLKAWDPVAFVQKVQKEGITLSSLVPSQVYDLVQKGFKAPKSLRAVLVGGDFLSADLYREARKKSWPLLPCYGSTETASHIACARLSSLNKTSFPKMYLLEGIKAQALKSSQDPNTTAQSLGGKKPLAPVNLKIPRIKIQSPGLLTAYFDLKSQSLLDPKDLQKALLLPDTVLLKGREIVLKSSSRIKILGESVDIPRLQKLLEKLAHSHGLSQSPYFLAVPDQRRGHCLILLSQAGPQKKDWDKLLSVKEQFNQELAPYERPHALYILPESLLSKGFIKFKPSVLLKELGFL